MRQSELFTKTSKTAPKDEVSRNAVLLSRAGYIHKEMAGVYSYFPLGLRTLNNIIGIIREEMNALGAAEVLMSSLQDATVWKTTDRWDDAKVDVWFKTKLKSGGEVGLGLTHEDPITAMLRGHLQSYRDLPCSLYQFQNKFRNETRAKSGIMRTREFIMKDLYSFGRTQEELDQFYDKVSDAYTRIFDRVGLGERTYKTFASGGIFSKYSHEFQTVCDAGEDTIYIDEKRKLAVNEEVMQDETLRELGLDRANLKEAKAVEVGNIFKLGTRFSEPLGLVYKDEEGREQPVIMGSYGIGPGRLMGTIVETLSDEHGLVWPESVAPYRVHLLSLGVDEKASEVYGELSRAGIEVLFDDRDMRAGEKFADADLLGLPFRVVVGKKSLESGVAEVKKRSAEEIREVPIAELVKYFQP